MAKWRYLVPAALSVACAALWLWPTTQGSGAGFLGMLGYVVATDWLLLAMRRPGITPQAQRLKRAARVLVGAPSAVLFLVAIENAVAVGDVAWEALPYAVLPVILVWPFVLLTLKGVEQPTDGA